MLKELRLDQLTPSPSNPRKTFDQVKLEELARSIGDVGVLEPILVRAHQNGKAAYEVVAGERRFRAATIAEVETVPCIVKELTDIQVLEIQTIENLQRDDLHPLEEAEGYAALMKEAGYDVEAIAQRISKSTKYVYDRIKLLQLIPELRKVFLDWEITAGHAILLARLGAADQNRCYGRGRGSWDGGLFQPDGGEDVPGLELDDRRTRKPRSVRELQTWINDHVRFRPEAEDLPNLFPETAAALETAQEEELKVIKITRDHQLKPETRESGERTYSRPSWKRADGEPDSYAWEEPKPSKTCEHSVLGVVVAGPGRGEAFRVCVAKKKCKIHWPPEKKKAAGSSPQDRKARQEEQQRKWAEERKHEEAERARWKQATPALLEALAERMREMPALELVGAVIERCQPFRGRGEKLDQLERGETLDDAVRYAAFLVLSDSINQWSAPRDAPKALKRYGIDAKKIVNQVAPPPKQEKPKPKATAKKRTPKKAATKKASTKAKKKTAEPEKAPAPIDAFVQAALEEDPAPGIDDLYDRAAELHPEVKKLTRRQFNARHVLPIKRKSMGARARRRAKASVE